MRKIFFTTILLFLALGQMWGETYPQGTPIFADIHSCGNWISESSTTGFRLWYGDGESDYEDIYGTNIAVGSNLYYAIVERDDVIKIQLLRMKNDHSETWNYSPISTVEEGKDVIVMTESDWTWTCSWQTSTTFYVTPSTLSYDNSASWDAEKTLYANIQVGATEYVKLAMESDGHNYSGAPIYKTTFYSPFGGVHRIQFQVYDGEDFKGEKIFVKTDPDPDWSHSECLTNISNKIYNGTSWLTYGRDITIYAVPEIMNGATWDEVSHSLYANFKYGDGDGEWVKVEMDKTAYTYKANPIYSATMFIRYNVIKRVEFLYNDGSDHELYVYVPSPQHVTGDIDDKIFIGAVSDIPTWNESYVRDYDIYYDINGGEWQSGWVGKRSYGEGDQDLSSDVTKLDYNFAGWYDNNEFAGSAYTAVSSTLADNIVLYAKWEPFSKSNFTPALNPIICTAAAGDVVVVAVSATQSDGAYIQLEDKDGVAFGSPVPVSGAGDYAIPLTASDAAKVNAGLIVSGSNYTISDVTIKYQKTLWTGTVSDNNGWAQSDDIGHSIFADLSADDFLGVYISAINDGETWHQYALRADYKNQFSGYVSSAPTTKTHQLTSAMVTALKDEKVKDITAQYLDVSALYTYVATKDYTVTLNTNDGTINDGNVDSYTFGVGATLPTNVTRTGYRFDGWFANEGLTGEPVAGITASDYGNKTYWAKWTSLEQTKTPANYSRLSVAEAGDILVVNVTAIGAGSSIKINKSEDGSNLFTKVIDATGKYAFQLSASDATALHTGMILSGTNYTGTVELLLKKTIWNDGLEDNSSWTATDNLGHTGLENIAEGDYLGFTVSELSDKGDYHQYAMQYNWSNVISSGVAATGTYLEEINGTLATNLAEGSEAVSLGAVYLTLSELNRYITTRDYTVTLNTNSGTINAGDVTGYTYPEGATLPTDVTRTGYTFAGWYPDAGFAGDRVYTISTSDYGNKEYWAKWTAKDYNISYDMNGGVWGSGWVGTRTYDAGDQAISGDVTKTDYNFAGWYDNGSFDGDAITAVSSTLADDITLYAKWTAFSKTTLTPALNPIICTASEGDVVVVTVSATQSASAYIQLEDKDGVAFGNSLPISGAGTYAIPLTSADAAKVNAGLNVSGSNYTISAVTIKYQKTLWDDGIDGTSTWTAAALSQSIFSDLSAGDFLGVTVTNTNGDGYYSYRIQINNVDLYEQAVSGTGTFIHQLTPDEITSLKTTDKTITIASGNSALSALYTYVATKDYTVTLNTNGGTINAGKVTSYTFGTGATLPTNVTKTGYTFAGWYNNEELDGDAVTTITTSDYGNKEYWAKWTPVTLKFTGDGGTSYDWFKTSCWSPACIPTIEHDVIIQNKATLYGPYGTGAAYGTGDATTRHAKAKSIKIDKTENENAKIEIWSRASLIVAEGIKVKKVVDEEIVDNQPTTPEDLYITTNILGNGGLICGDASSTTQAEYEFYSKSFKYDTYLVNQYVGIPFASLNANQLYSMNIFVYDDEHDAWKTPESNTLVPFTAYNYINKWSLAYNVYNLTGTLALPGIGEEREKQVLTCGSRYNASGTFDGEGENNGDYMFANSWTAPINIASMTAADFSGTAGADMEQTIYIFNAGWLNPSEDAKKEIGDNAGQWTAFPIASAAGMTNAIIPATQAFCVTAKAANAKLTLDYKKHVYDPAIGADSLSTFATRAPRRERAEETPVRLKMMVHKDSAIADNIYIFEREDFSYDFDNGWDGRKIFGKSLVPQLYTIRWNTNLAVDAVPDMDGTLIGFKAGTDTNSYTFTFEYNGGEPLFLYDQDLNVFTQITSEATYSFTTDDTAAHQRFMLTRSNAPAISTWFETVESESADEVKKMIINDQIFILRGGQMYDVTGKRAQ